MRRISHIQYLRILFSGATASVLLLLTLYGIGKAVWVARVFENAPSDVLALAQFFIAAFSQTELVVQALTLLTLFSAFYLARASSRFISQTLTPSRA